jgi:hypothetical protein
VYAMTEPSMEWKLDRHISASLVIGFVAQTLFGAIWIGWWGSSYNSQLAVLTATVAELRVEQRQMQTQISTQSALSDKRLALLESAVPEIKQVQAEIRDDIQQLSRLMNDYIVTLKRNGNGIK